MAGEAGVEIDDRGPQRIELLLGPSFDGVDEAEQATEMFARAAGFEEDLACHLAMALREAAINGLLHGNRQAPEKRVRVICESTKEALTITVVDQGEGMDPETIPDPLAPENLMKSSGRGVLLMRSIMDEVYFTKLATGMEVRMVKRRET